MQSFLRKNRVRVLTAFFIDNIRLLCYNTKKARKRSLDMKNPVVDGWYADPESRVYGDTVYMYVTNSLPYEEVKSRPCYDK